MFENQPGQPSNMSQMQPTTPNQFTAQPISNGMPPGVPQNIDPQKLAAVLKMLGAQGGIGGGIANGMQLGQMFQGLAPKQALPITPLGQPSMMSGTQLPPMSGTQLPQGY